ncbi:CocE/NonD family hydrolase [Streptomyces sp. NPDC020794]|uniref:CocE/NonD family hydrolase n=1 Tax=unclassified Streptomyces TaxID=2593676 RepID=UPI0036ED2DF0
MSASPPDTLRANERVPGWDGTPLAVDIHLPPRAQWPVPTVVTRTPYGRSAHLAEGAGWRGRGFAYVVQDVRGRYDSDGHWQPYHNERGDGAALADWILTQPWSDGRLVAYGGSYAGHTAWALAAERPAAVSAVVSMGPSMALGRTKFERSGILRLAEHAAWWLERADARTSRDGLTAHVFREQPRLLEHLPVMDLGERLGARLPGWGHVVENGPHHRVEGPDTAELEKLPSAALHIGGWYDLLVDEVLEHFHRAGSALTPRPPRSLVIGPWGHDLAFAPGTRIGDRDHGPASRLDLGALQLDWLRRVLAEKAGSGSHSEAKVFTVGADTWWTGRSWPPPGTDTVWYAHHDGSLARPVPRRGGQRRFRYDPADPYPSRQPAVDRAPLAARTDAVRFTSAPIDAPLTVAGRPVVVLNALTSAPSTDWIVRWNELTADGRCLELAHGSVDTGRDGDDSGRYEILLGPVCVTLPTGSRLQLEVTSSDFPRLARALGTHEDRYRGTACALAQQTVRTRPVDGTRLILPTPGDHTPDHDLTEGESP